MKLLIPDNCWGWKLTSLIPHTREATLLPWISTTFVDLENKEHYSSPESPPHHNHWPLPRHEAVMRPLAPPCPHLLPLLAWIAALLPSLPNLFIFKVRQNCATPPYHGNFGICLGCSYLPDILAQPLLIQGELHGSSLKCTFHFGKSFAGQAIFKAKAWTNPTFKLQ